MNRCFLVCYDIRDPRRLNRVHRTMKGYGEPWQYSIFFCVLGPVARVRMERALTAEANLKEDSILILELGSEEGSVRDAVTALGGSLPEIRRTVVI